MSFPVYESYRQIGSFWFDSLPSYWGIAPLRWISSIYAGGTPDKRNVEFWENGSIPWLNSGSVNQSEITKPSALITVEAFRNSSAKWIPAGGLVVALAGQGKTKGTVAQLTIESTCNQSMAAIVPSQPGSER
ncbi:restriction endonuclease subunit S [Marinospirillum perlucidum]|uniref:restriction endonuclease subunit S n=1 Tax=Marinospirillum perlucidum TaxID=1982602 RepID=UPI000DF1230F